jgi:transcriptional regulator with XRE-family HTH domain
MKCEKELALLREAIRNERKDKRITQEELAEMLEVSPTHIKHIESGHRKPSIEILFEISKILNISLDSVVFSKNESARTDTREKIDRLLDISDEASLRFILSVLEALREKEQTSIK